jgi:hypothetical protein
MKARKKSDGKIDQILDHVAKINTRLALMDERQANMEKDTEFLVESDKSQERRLLMHSQTLYGEDGNNGLKKTVSENRDRIISAEKKMIGMSSVASVAGAVIAFIARKIFG